jgi:TRAP-type uncharacterized transport system substrate-binding protein
MDCLLARALSVSLLGFGFALVVTAQLVSAESTATTAEGVVLSSGVEGGGYWNAGTRLQTVATEKFHLKIDNRPSTGSVENIEKLLDTNSPVNLAFVQADAAQYYLNLHDEDRRKLDLLENIGQECVFIVTGIDSGIRTDADMQKASDLRVGIDSVSSGMAVTFDYMVSQIPEMSDIQVSYGNTLASVQHLNASDATVDAVMMVHRPRERSPEVDYALENADRYRFVELSDERLTQELWNGWPIYRTMSLAMPGSEKPVKTICVMGLLLANKQKLTLDQRNQLSDLVSYHWMKVYATQ